MGSSPEYINTIEPVVLTGARKPMVRPLFRGRGVVLQFAISYTLSVNLTKSESSFFFFLVFFFLNNIFLGFRRRNNGRVKIPCSMYKCTKDLSRSEEEKYVEHGRKI